MDDNVALEFVFHDCPAERLDWALSTRVIFSAKRAMEEPCPLRSWPAVAASYIVCAKDRTITPQGGSARPLTSCWEWSRLNCPVDIAHTSAVLRRSRRSSNKWTTSEC